MQKTLKITEIFLRIWMAYILISNSGIGIVTPLESLNMPTHIYQLIKSMWDTGYMMHLVKLTELVAGISLLFNFYVPLILLALIPVVINIYGMHLFVFDRIFTNGLGMVLICLFLVYRHFDKYKHIIKIR